MFMVEILSFGQTREFWFDCSKKDSTSCFHCMLNSEGYYSIPMDFIERNDSLIILSIPPEPIYTLFLSLISNNPSQSVRRSVNWEQETFEMLAIKDWSNKMDLKCFVDSVSVIWDRDVMFDIAGSVYFDTGGINYYTVDISGLNLKLLKIICFDGRGKGNYQEATILYSNYVGPINGWLTNRLGNAKYLDRIFSIRKKE